jgi:hypothetical protein
MHELEAAQAAAALTSKGQPKRAQERTYPADDALVSIKVPLAWTQVQQACAFTLGRVAAAYLIGPNPTTAFSGISVFDASVPSRSVGRRGCVLRGCPRSRVRR